MVRGGGHATEHSGKTHSLGLILAFGKGFSGKTVYIHTLIKTFTLIFIDAKLTDTF